MRYPVSMITHDEEQLNIRRLLYQKEERHLMEKLAKKRPNLKLLKPAFVPGFLSANAPAAPAA